MALNLKETWQRNLTVCLFGSFTTVLSMTLMLPFLPLYVEQLGVHGHAAIVQWTGVAYGATFITAGLVAPLWGYLGDRFGRKSMLVRASFGLTICVSLMGLATHLWHLVLLRLLVGLAAGYSSGSTILVAVQTPKDRSGQALGLLASGVMAGNLVGPLVGGALSPLIGIRATFYCAAALIGVAFVATVWLVREVPRPMEQAARPKVRWAEIPNRGIVATMLLAGLLLMIANMSIEPIITVYVAGLVHDPKHVTVIAGVVMSAAALGSVLSASRLGQLADRIGHVRVIALGLAAAALLLVPQAFVSASWQLIVLRFLMGMALGGLLPCIAATIRHNVPEHVIGTALGYSLSSQFAGQFTGPLIGGFVGGHIGMRAVFMATSALLFVAAACVRRAGRAPQPLLSTPA